MTYNTLTPPICPHCQGTLPLNAAVLKLASSDPKLVTRNRCPKCSGLFMCIVGYATHSLEELPPNQTWNIYRLKDEDQYFAALEGSERDLELSATTHFIKVGQMNSTLNKTPPPKP